MPAESLTQVVDENDNPIEVQQRDHIQKNGLWHRVVGVWIVDETGNVLVQKRQVGRGLDDSKLDSSASGHGDPGEDYLDTGVREAEEEIGVHINPVELEQVAYFRTENTNGEKTLRRFTKVFIARVGRDALDLLTIDNTELGGTEWLSPEEVKELVTIHPEDTVPGFIIAWYVRKGLPVPEDISAENNLKLLTEAR